MHGDARRHAGVDRTRGAVLGDRAHQVERGAGGVGQARALLAEEQDAALGQLGGLQRHRAREVVDAHHRQPLAGRPVDERLDRRMVRDVQVPIRDHRTTPVPAATSDDVDGRRAERVRVADDRPDVEVVVPVLDGHVEGMSPGVEVGDDRIVAPVAIAVDHVAAIAVGQQLGIEAVVVGPRLGVWTDADRIPLGTDRIPAGEHLGQLVERGDGGIGPDLRRAGRPGPVQPDASRSGLLRRHDVLVEQVADVDELLDPAPRRRGRHLEQAGVRLADAHAVGNEVEREPAGEVTALGVGVAVGDETEQVRLPQRRERRDDIVVEADLAVAVTEVDLGHPIGQRGVVHAEGGGRVGERLLPQRVQPDLRAACGRPRRRAGPSAPGARWASAARRATGGRPRPPRSPAPAHGHGHA